MGLEEDYIIENVMSRTGLTFYKLYHLGVRWITPAAARATAVVAPATTVNTIAGCVL